MVRIVRTDCELECPGIDAGLRARGAELVLLPDGIGENELIAATAEADLILMCYTPIGARVIGNARRLKGIVKYGVGIDAIDLTAARAHGVPVVNVPDYAEETVAEGAFALMIALAKKLPALSAEMRRTGWARPEARWLARDIAGSTLGLIGTGRIGRSMARMAGAGFRARVLGYDPHVPAEAMRAAGIEKRDDLRAMLGECDFVSIHCTLSASTHHLVGAREFAAMRPHAIFINVSRGAIVAEAALVRALTSGTIGGAGLDVFSREPLALEGHPMSPLFAMPNVILTPHLAFFTAEAMARLEEDTLARCDEILTGRPLLVKSQDPRLRQQSSGVVFG